MHRRMISRAQSNIASTKQISLPFHPTITDLFFTILTIEPIQLLLFRLLRFHVVYLPLFMQLSMPFQHLSFLVLVSPSSYPDRFLLTSSFPTQPVSPLGFFFAQFRVSWHAQHLDFFLVINSTPLPSQASPRGPFLS